MRGFTHIHLSIGVSAAALVLGSTPVFAQTAAPAAEQPATTGGLEDIIVTAQRKAERLQDVPISVNAATAQTLQNRGISNLSVSDIPQIVPSAKGVEIVGRPAFFLRGIGSNAVNANNEPSVAVYVDGVFMAAPGANQFAFNNIDRIEVLKGPQGTLFGRNATGGVVQVVTRDPNLTVPKMEAKAGYGNYDAVFGEYYGSTPLASNLAIDLAVHYNARFSGWSHNVVSGKETDKGSAFGVRSKLLWEPTDRTTLRVAGDFMRNNFNGPLPVGVAGQIAIDGSTVPNRANPRDYPANYETLYLNKGGGVSLNVDHDLDFAHLISISAYRKTKGRFVDDNDHVTSDLALADFTYGQRQYSQEFQLVAPRNRKFDWTLGLFGYDSKAFTSPALLEGPAVFAPTGNPVYIRSVVSVAVRQIYSNQHTKSFSPYAQATYEVVPDLKVTGGIRFTTEKQNFNGRIVTVQTKNLATGIVTPVGTTFVPPAQEQSFNKFTWRIAADYSFTKDVHAYASYNRGIKSGGFSGSNPAGLGYAPEILDAYEVGLKSELFDRHLRFNAAGFYYDYKNIQVTSLVGGVAVINNAASATIKGIDVDLEAVPVENLTIQGGFVVLKSKYNNFANASSSPPSALMGPATTFSAKGNQIPYASPFSANAAISYVIPSDVGNFRASVSGSYTSGFYWNPDNRLRQGKYALLNTNIGWSSKSKRLEIEFWTKNLTNKLYSIYTDESFTGDQVTYAPPRTYGFTLTVRY